uniref:hypothetical protein n=1 Tax=Sphingobacterium sp. TaxID=341027 RepID=UPI00289F1EEB
MPLELIPVIEIGYNNQGIPTPDKYPYWEYPMLWDKYNAESYKKAGFKDDLNYPEFGVDILITLNSSLGSIFCVHSSSSGQLACRKPIPS